MNNDKTPGDYEVGYGKPPKNTQFQKGSSGNPGGRPKKSRDFDSELLREAESFITINDNGQRRRISKIEGIAKQLTNKAMTGNIPAARTYLDHYLRALELKLAADLKLGDKGKYTARDLTDEELLQIIAAGQKETKRESRKRQVSNTD